MYEPLNTPYEYVGDIPALGGTALTELAQSFEELEATSLEPLFPSEIVNARTIVIERVYQGLGIAPIVKPGIPAGNFMEGDRVERKVVEPAYIREDDFLDQFLINDLRQVGTMNERYQPVQIIKDRVRKLVNRQNRRIEQFRIDCLLGGINYFDPRTNVSINVSTNLPDHNLFRYDGWNATLASGGDMGSGGFVAAKNLTNNKNRTEALLFTDTNGNAAVPWTNPDADIVRTLRLLKQYLANTNKNLPSDIVMSRDLFTVLQENNIIKTFSGAAGTGVNQTFGSILQLGPGGDITSIAGLNIILVDNLYSDPGGAGIMKMWPSNKVAVVSRYHVNDRSATLGRTAYCIGEAPDGRPGMWFRTGPDQQPPATPGRTMQMGNSFMPYAVYPNWIAILDVCEPSEIDSTLILRADLGYGTY